ncbi:MAG TPA: MmgE/PrpD family protein [Burkholderiales bacterium]|nr:MmgE/PrpD family protein [Burkholderiales bacterium]
MPLTITETLAAHVAAARPDRIPEAVTQATRQFVLDTVAVAWAGAAAPGGRALRDQIAADGGTPEATLWAWGGRFPAAAAAFVNGVSAAALDYDSVYEAGSVHADVVVVPAAWAMAERTGASGAELIAAVALGTDIACRIGKASRKNSGWFYTSLGGVFGAAAACARLLKLDADGIANAMGLALSHAGGTQQALLEKTDAKRLQSAFAARSAVFCAQLAASGMSAPREAFEGTYGYFRKYEDCDAGVLLARLGETWENTRSALKKYPSCTANHAPVESAIALAEELEIRPDDVTEVEVTLSPFSHRLVGGPFEPAANPQVAAQFSIQYSLACALLRRRLAVADIGREAVLDPAVGALTRKVKVVVDESNKGKFAPASLTLATTRHGRMRCEAPHVPGTPEHPLTAAEHRAKVRDCLGFGPRPLAGDAAAALIERIENLGSVGDMRRFFDGLPTF